MHHPGGRALSRHRSGPRSAGLKATGAVVALSAGFHNGPILPQPRAWSQYLQTGDDPPEAEPADQGTAVFQPEAAASLQAKMALPAPLYWDDDGKNFQPPGQYCTLAIQNLEMCPGREIAPPILTSVYICYAYVLNAFQ